LNSWETQQEKKGFHAGRLQALAALTEESPETLNWKWKKNDCAVSGLQSLLLLNNGREEKLVWMNYRCLNVLHGVAVVMTTSMKSRMTDA
jgi:hypothetical protein